MEIRKILPEAEAMEYFKDLVQAIEALYEKNIIHRDIKPSNILIKDERLILGDFGLCQTLESKEEKIHGSFGSPMYMAPEALENKFYKINSDLYSIGVKIFF